MKTINIISGLLLVLLLVVTACGTNSGSGENQPSNYRLNGAEYLLLGDASLKTSETTLEGVGKLVFSDPRLKEDNNYRLEFSLPNNGSVTLVANAEKDLSKGVEILFSREGSLLKVVMDGADISEAFTEVDAAQTVTMAIDVHAHGHAVFWPNGGAEIEEAFSTRPKAKFWGLIVKGALVSKAEVGDAVDVH